jgi:type I restriction enzyme S subunit
VFEFLGVTSGWPIKALGDFLNINTNSEIDIDNFDTYQMLGVKSRGGGIVIRRSEDGFELTMKRYQVASSGQLMWCKVDTKNGAFGVTLKDHENALASQNMCLADINTDLCLPNFLQLFFRFPAVYNKLTNASLGTTNRQYLKPQELLSKVRLHLAPIEEQKHIIAKIESMMARIEVARKLRAEAMEEVESLVGTAVLRFFAQDKENGWSEGKIGDYVLDDLYGTSEKTTDDETGTPILRMGNIQHGRLDTPDLKYLHLNEKDREKLLLRKGDILAYINSPIGRTYMFSERKQMTGQANVNAKKLKAMPIPLPPISEQRRIVTYLHSLQAKVDELKRLHAETEKELEELVPSILDKAFKGEL